MTVQMQPQQLVTKLPNLCVPLLVACIGGGQTLCPAIPSRRCPVLECLQDFECGSEAQVRNLPGP